jgi:hypothetical protein
VALKAPLFHVGGTCGAAEAVPFQDSAFAARLKAVPFPVKIKVKVKGSGQECPLHTIKVRGARFFVP